MNSKQYKNLLKARYPRIKVDMRPVQPIVRLKEPTVELSNYNMILKELASQANAQFIRYGERKEDDERYDPFEISKFNFDPSNLLPPKTSRDLKTKVNQLISIATKLNDELLQMNFDLVNTNNTEEIRKKLEKLDVAIQRLINALQMMDVKKSYTNADASLVASYSTLLESYKNVFMTLETLLDDIKKNGPINVPQALNQLQIVNQPLQIPVPPPMPGSKQAQAAQPSQPAQPSKADLLDFITTQPEEDLILLLASYEIDGEDGVKKLIEPQVGPISDDDIDQIVEYLERVESNFDEGKVNQVINDLYNKMQQSQKPNVSIPKSIKKLKTVPSKSSTYIDFNMAREGAKNMKKSEIQHKIKEILNSLENAKDEKGNQITDKSRTRRKVRSRNKKGSKELRTILMNMANPRNTDQKKVIINRLIDEVAVPDTFLRKQIIKLLDELQNKVTT